MELTSHNVTAIMMDCLYKPEEITDGQIPDGAVLVHGITLKMGFHPERIESHHDDLVSMLEQLPDEFSAGGDWSFLNACNRKDGVQWGEHKNMQELFLLGMGIRRVACLMAKPLWKALPGEMPYYHVILGDHRPPVVQDGSDHVFEEKEDA